MTFSDPVLDAAFEDIFGGQPDNAERMARYLSKKARYWQGEGLKKLGPWVLEYEARGDTFFTSGATPEEALARTSEKEPQGWIFNNIMTETEWFNENSNSLKRGQRTNHDNGSLRTITNNALEESTPK